MPLFAFYRIEDLKFSKLFAALGLLLAIGVGLYLYWQYESKYPSTQDAYLRANIVSIAAQVTGQVATVEVEENQKVKPGDLLFTIDSTLMKAEQDQAAAQLDSALKEAESFVAQISAASSAVSSAQTVLDTANKQLGRTQTLVDTGDATKVALDQAQSSQAQAAAALSSAQAQLQAAQSGLVAKQDAVRSARAQVEIAAANMNWTRVVSPADGWISNLTLRPGSAVAAYSPQFAVIESQGWWVDANFKETDLPNIKPGQPVRLTVDLLPGKTLTGKVASLGMGSTATFSLLPAQNASGNFVKVTQRFPVKILLDPTDFPLRVGASVNPQVDTTGSSTSSE